MTADDRTGSVIEVALSGPDFNDLWMSALNGLPNLKSLTLAHTNVTGRALFRIKRWPKLEDLHLAGNQFDDKTLEQVAKASNLRTLRLTGTNVTNDGIIALQKALPGLVITREP